MIMNKNSIPHTGVFIHVLTQLEAMTLLKCLMTSPVCVYLLEWCNIQDTFLHFGFIKIVDYTDI